MTDIRRMARIQFLVIGVFAIFKFIRPPLIESQAPEILKVFLFSFPNFCEAIIGVLTLTILGLIANKNLKEPRRLRAKSIYILATLLAAVYVISQELKFHNLGGNNVYDPMDVVFSVAGLLLGYLLLKKMKPIIR